MDEKPCPAHQVDTCFTYKITGPKYPTRTIIYQGRDGWLIESETRW